MKRPRLRRVLKWGAAIVLVPLLVLVVVVVVDGWRAFGGDPAGARLERMQRSPQFQDGVFENPQPLHNDFWGMIGGMFDKSEVASPTDPLPVLQVDKERFAAPPPSGLRVTWLGHSTLVIEIDGATILTDPVWSERISPVTWAGPRRWYPPPLALADVPPIDAVVISHDHYDHLDYPTMAAMAAWDAPFVVPLGVGAHLAAWGIPEARIIELDWWERTTVRDVEIVATPARHASGRTPFDNGSTLWASYALIGAKHRAWFSGDTGLFPAMTEIGEKLGPFDVTMIESGAYGSAWPDWHLGPEQAVRAHEMVRGKLLVPIHWGLFDLAFHGWTEPVERIIVAAERAGAPLAVPRPGESVEPSTPPPIVRWWPEVPWKTADEDPIVATKMGPAAVATP